MTIVHYSFNPDLARTAAASLAYPDDGRSRWTPNFPQPDTIAPPPEPRYTTDKIRAALNLPGVDIGSWERYANCRGAKADLFFPERGDMAAVTAGKAVCAGCTVRVECLTAALNAGERWGIWGGLSDPERRKLRKRLAVEAVAA